jgi:HEAT repeat protein
MLHDSRPPRSNGFYGEWLNVLEALSYLGPEALPILLGAAANSPSPEFQRDVIHVLGNFGPDGAPAIPALLAWSRHEDSWIRLWAVCALGRITQQPAAVIPVLLSALKDSESIVRREAAQGLGRYGKAASHGVPELIRAADDPDWHAQPGAIAALVQIGEQPDVVLPLLVRKLHDGNWILRRCAASALGDFGGQKAFDALMEAADDFQGFVREIVFQSLKRIDPAALENSGRKFKTSGPPRG